MELVYEQNYVVVGVLALFNDRFDSFFILAAIRGTSLECSEVQGVQLAKKVDGHISLHNTLGQTYQNVSIALFDLHTLRHLRLLRFCQHQVRLK